MLHPLFSDSGVVAAGVPQGTKLDPHFPILTKKLVYH